MDAWNLIWIVVCSDTIIKFLIISVKAFVTLLPFSIIPLRKRVSQPLKKALFFDFNLIYLFILLGQLLFNDRNIRAALSLSHTNTSMDIVFDAFWRDHSAFITKSSPRRSRRSHQKRNQAIINGVSDIFVHHLHRI